MLIFILFVCIVLIACVAARPDVKPESLPPVDTSLFIHAEGTRLIGSDGQPFLVKGIAFGNSVWGNPSDSSAFTHHRMDAYADIASMGFNSVRFYLNYGLFESDSRPCRYKESGFEWIDRNIAAAKEQGIYLVLNMHYPQGGFQSNGAGDDLWNKAENRKRLVALWREIAKRYRGEAQIIGYGPVNEPVPVKGLSQWETLVSEIVAAIREVDGHHLIFVERAIWTKAGASKEESENLLFPRGLDSGGLVYEFHMYDPMPFTHQNAPWTSYKGLYATYPDDNRFGMEDLMWAGYGGSTEKAGTGNSDWTRYEGELYRVADERFVAGYPAVQVHTLGRKGRVYVDDIQIEEFDAHGSSLGIVWTSQIDDDSGWSFWSREPGGRVAIAKEGKSNGLSVSVSGTVSDANITHYSSPLRVTQGHSYRISGWLKGKNITAGATARLRIDFFSGNPAAGWNREYLASRLRQYLEYGNAHNVPLYLGEFGLMHDAFEENRGGEQWIADMLDILEEHNVNYNYHTYHESHFGLYVNSSGYPEAGDLNTVLAGLFRMKQLRE